MFSKILFLLLILYSVQEAYSATVATKPSKTLVNISTINTESIQGCSVNGGKIKVLFGSSEPLTAPFIVQALNGNNSVASSLQTQAQGQVFLTQLAPGTYTVKVMDAAGNFGTKNGVTVPVYSPIVITAKVKHIYQSSLSGTRKNTGAIDVTLTGGQMPQVFIWSKGPTANGPFTQIQYVNSMGVSTQPPDLINLEAGFYKLEVFTTNGCSYVYVYEIKVNPVLQPNSLVQ